MQHVVGPGGQHLVTNLATVIGQDIVGACTFDANIFGALGLIFLAGQHICHGFGDTGEKIPADRVTVVFRAFIEVIARNVHSLADGDSQAEGHTAIGEGAGVAIVTGIEFLAEDGGATAGFRIAEGLLARTILGGIADYYCVRVNLALIVSTNVLP